MMQKIIRKLGWAMVGVAVLTSCDKENEVEPTDFSEHKYVRVLVSDELTTQVSLVNPRAETVETFEALYPKSAFYTTASGRFGAAVHRENNKVQLFDTGFENHGDHIDVRGTPKWASILSEGKQPTHLKTKGDEVIVFNDGDGTLSVGKESEFQQPGAKFKSINVGNVAHHGAMTKFDNGTYSITEKDGSIAGTLPERVKVVDATGKLLHASTVATKGIHGNASDGNAAVYGSASGLLVVESTGNQRLIAHPADFGTAWFGSILEGGQTGKFVGYTAAKGAYLIDVTTDQITPIVQTDDIMQVGVDHLSNHLVVLMHSGEVKIFDLKNNTLKTSGSILSATAKDEKQKPKIVATSRSLYVTQPKTGELLIIPVADLSKSSRLKVSKTPYSLSIVGMESSSDH